MYLRKHGQKNIEIVRNKHKKRRRLAVDETISGEKRKWIYNYLVD